MGIFTWQDWEGEKYVEATSECLVHSGCSMWKLYHHDNILDPDLTVLHMSAFSTEGKQVGMGVREIISSSFLFSFAFSLASH